MKKWKRVTTQETFDSIPNLTRVRYWDSNPAGGAGSDSCRCEDVRLRYIKKCGCGNTIVDEGGMVRTNSWKGWLHFEYLAEDPMDEEASRIAEMILG